MSLGNIQLVLQISTAVFFVETVLLDGSNGLLAGVINSIL